MDLKLSSEITAGLKRVGNPTLVSDELFLKLLNCCTTTITQTDLLSANISNALSGSSKGDVVKEANCALASLFVEAARVDLPPEAICLCLETTASWPKTRSKKLFEAYMGVAPKIQAFLLNIGFHPPHVVDVHWSLNHITKCSNNEHSSSSVVAVQLETEGDLDNSGEKYVKFVCTLPELQDLLSKLKEALRQMEHAAHKSSP